MAKRNKVGTTKWDFLLLCVFDLFAIKGEKIFIYSLSLFFRDSACEWSFVRCDGISLKSNNTLLPS